MEVVNVTVVDTPEVVAVNVAVGFGTVVNSDSTYSATVNSGQTLMLPDMIVKNTAGTTILTQPSATSTGVIADSVVTNSNNRFSLNVPAETNPVLTDIIHIDSDGTIVVLPAMTAMVCTPHVGADVENSDGSYTQHVNNGATLVLPDTVVKNTAGTTVLNQPSATSTGVIADSVVSNSDDSFVVNVPAEEPLELADITVYSKDANGQTIATPYPSMKDYTEVGSIPDANGWIRPADWLPISHLVTDGEEKAVALYAVWDAAGIAQGYNNYCALLCRGAYTVDWGDGTVDNVADNVQAEHTYVYANLPASSYCSRGYRQAVITITPQAGQHLTLLSFSRKHTLVLSTSSGNNYLDVQISGTNITRTTFFEFGGTRCYMLEHLYLYQITTALNDLTYFIAYCMSLYSIEVDNLNTVNVLNFGSLAASSSNLKYALNINTINATNMSSIYSGIGASVLNLSLYDTSKVTTFANFLAGNARLIKPNLSSINTSNATSLSQFAVNCYALEELDLSHTTLASCTDNTNIVLNCVSLKKLRLPQIGRTFTVANSKLTATELNLLFTDVRDLNGSISTLTINAAGTGYAIGNEVNITAGNNNAVLKVLTIGAGGAVTSYLLKVAGTGYSVASGLATSNITGTGSGFKVNVTALVAPQTLTYTGNPGAATCDPSILTAKNWIGVG